MTQTFQNVAKAPCRECPFRKRSAPGWLGGGEHGLASEYLQLAHSDENVPCHLSEGFTTDNPWKTRPCAGLALYRANVLKTPREGAAREAVKAMAASPHRDEVFASPAEFLAHHDTDTNRRTVESMRADQKRKD